MEGEKKIQDVPDGSNDESKNRDVMKITENTNTEMDERKATKDST